jgi:hypothetical protein
MEKLPSGSWMWCLSTFSWQAYPTGEHFGSVANGPAGRYLSMVDGGEEESRGTAVLTPREARYADVCGGRQLSVVDADGEVEDPSGADVVLERDAMKLAVSDGRSYSASQSEEEGNVAGAGVGGGAGGDRLEAVVLLLSAEARGCSLAPGPLE